MYSHSRPFDDCVHTLVGLGFNRILATNAARRYNGNAEQAANYLLSLTEPNSTSPTPSPTSSTTPTSVSTTPSRLSTNTYAHSHTRPMSARNSASHPSTNSRTLGVPSITSPTSAPIPSSPLTTSTNSFAQLQLNSDPMELDSVNHHTTARTTKQQQASSSSPSGATITHRITQFTVGTNPPMTRRTTPSASAKPHQRAAPSSEQHLPTPISSLSSLPSPGPIQNLQTPTNSSLLPSPSSSSSSSVSGRNLTTYSQLKIVPMTPSASSSSFFNSTPQSGALPITPAQALSPVGLDPNLVEALVPFLQTVPLPPSLTPESLHSHAVTLGTHTLPLGPNSFIDVRDSLGKWLEARVLQIDSIRPNEKKSIVNLKLFVHYLAWDSKWDEWIVPMDDPSRIAPFRSWSEGSSTESGSPISPNHIPPHWVTRGEFVIAYFKSDGKKRQSGWMIGRIAKIDGLQMQVDMHPPWTAEYALTLSASEQIAPKKVQRWFHARSDQVRHISEAIRLLEQHQQQQRPQLSSRPRSSYASPSAQSSLLMNNASSPVPVSSPSRSPSLASSRTPEPVPAQAQPLNNNNRLSQSSQQRPGAPTLTPQFQRQPLLPLSPTSPRPILPLRSTQQGSPSSARQTSDSFNSPHRTQSGGSMPSIDRYQSNSFESAPMDSSPTVTGGALLRSSSIPLSPTPVGGSISIPPTQPSPVPSPSSSSSSLTSSSQPQWFKGQFLEIKDSVGKFLPAEVLLIDATGSRIFVHYEGWSSRWDEWIDTTTESSRIRALGSALAETAAERQRKSEEEQFRSRLCQRYGFTIFDCESDGSCLFRAFSHQIYGTVDRHMEVRQKCYDHMESDREYFAKFIAEEFDAYVKKRRQDKEWGDHIEIVALRELFNTEVEIYNYDCVTKDDGRPIRMSTGATLSHLTNDDRHSIPIVRLSYHGSNHYNSIVDPTHPPPIGDGRQAKINLRQLRQEHEAKESEEAQQRKQRETGNKSTLTANASSSSEDQPKPARIVRSSSNQNIPSPTLRRPSNVHTPLSSTTAAPSPTRVKV